MAVAGADTWGGGEEEEEPAAERAALLFQQAALQRDAQGMYLLARAYHEGMGVAKDAVRAARWYKEAAKAGFREASRALARCYFEGVRRLLCMRPHTSVCVLSFYYVCVCCLQATAWRSVGLLQVH